MKKTKKILILFAFMLVFVIALSACGKGGDEQSMTDKTVYFTVVFDSNGGGKVPSQTVESGSTANRPASPSLKGMVFEDWYYLGAPWDFSSPVNSDVTLTAKWLDPSVKHRVAVGVERYYANRGSAGIDGTEADNRVYSSGSVATVIARAEEGYEFSGWENYSTGKIVSKNAEYSFMVKEDVVLRALFSQTLVGLDDPKNDAFWRALNASEERGQITLRALGAEGWSELTVAFDESLGVYAIKGNAGGNDADVIIKRTDGGYEAFVRGEEGYARFDLPAGEREDSSENRDETLLSVYNLFRGRFVEGEGLGFTVDLSGYLDSARDELIENGDGTVYGILGEYLDEAINSFNYPGVNTADILSAASIEDMASAMSAAILLVPDLSAEEAEFAYMLANLKSNVYGAIDDLSERFTSAGMEFDAAGYKRLADEYLSSSISGAIAKLKNQPAGEPYQGDAAFTDALLYMIVSNCTVNDIAMLFLDRVGLSGTVWDITDPDADFSDCYLSGEVIVEGGKIYSVVAESPDGRFTVEYSSEITVSLEIPEAE
ncbi:MAG: InlB B-repeat-containing protein [Clostridia bacterium]|nr:InlB B-repeat-containing protein [Clostridia bacterium]